MRRNSVNKEFISALLNFFVWGLGYFYVGENVLGILWLVVFVTTYLPVFYLGIDFYQKTVAGSSMLMGYLIVSIILLYHGLKAEAENVSWQQIVRDWKIFFLGMLIVGLAIELVNEFLFHRWWVYHPPWSLYSIFSSLIGLPLILGWLILTSLALLFSYLLIKHTHIRFIGAYLFSWIGIGFIAEPINSLVWNTWHYKKTIWTVFDPLGLGYGILVPIMGYGLTGLTTYMGYIIIKLFYKR
jgi:hypothetical protein